jgi:uncharacterized protein
MILVDTGAWYALSDIRERIHGRAIEAFARITRGEFGRVVTTDYILDETFTLLRMRHGIDAVRAFRDLLSLSNSFQMLRVSDRDFEQALELLLAHEDKLWSFTDCTSFVLMRELQIQDAFAFDQNFVEAGFRVVPAK